MKKTLLLFLFIFLPFLGFSQVDLVKWDAASNSNRNTPTSIVATVAGQDLTNNGASLQYISYNSDETFYQTGSWPTPADNGGEYNPAKYIQFAIKPNSGNKVDLSSFTFQCRSGSGKFRIKYSKDASFSTGVKDLLTETVTPNSWTTYNLNFSTEINPVLDTETVYVRFYSYSTNNTFEIKTGTNTNNVIPVIKGTVSSFNANKILAINDYVSTKKELGVNINILNNDVKKENVTSLIISTAPTAGMGRVIINPDKTVTFNPAVGFTGSATFNYTISNATETSTATVKVTVSDDTDDTLSLWNGASNSFNPITNAYVNSASPITATGASLGYIYQNTTTAFFQTGSWPTPQQNSGSLDLNKYIQFKINPDSNHQLNLKQFNFTYRGANGQKFQVRYSKDINFASGVKVLIPETNSASSWTALTGTFSTDTSPVLSTETVYVRFYVYNTNNTFEIKNGNGNSEGPAITGTVKDVNTLTANDDAISTPSNVAVVIPILANDVIGGSALQAITVTQPSNGTVTVNGTTNITFTPASGFTGTASFTYTLRNANSNYSSATVNVNGTAPTCVASETAGINYWKGFVYTYTGNTPAATTYVGSVAEKAIFDRNVDENTITGDTTVEANNFCGTVPSDKFFVRYLMQTTVATAGTYSFTIGGDDGVRLYIDGALVTMSPTNSWGDHSYIRYAAQYNLTAGTHNFVLEYYENAQSARVSFSYGAIKGDTTFPFGDNKWNVYGFSLPDISLNPASYAGTYVDTNLNINTQTYWNKTKSPSYASNWQGAPMDINQFAITYKRQGFDCGNYQIQLVNCDDVAEVYIDGVKIFTQNGYTNTVSLINNGQYYPLDKNSKVEVRLREDGGDANVAFNFIYTASAAPVASVTTQPTCAVNTGTITFSSPAPATGITYSIDGTTYTNTTGVFYGVAVGSYNVSTKNSAGCTSATTTVNVNAATGKTWNGATSANWNVATNWTPNGVPTASDCVVIPDLTNITNKPVVSGTEVVTNANVLTISNKGSLVIQSSNTLKVENSITVETTGSLIFENNSSLIQVNTSPAINSGKITYKRIAPQIRQADYVYWSTPVTPQRLIDVSPLTSYDKFFGYSGSGWVSTYPTGNMVVGKGYIIRGPNGSSNTTKADYQASFIGTPNNGTLSGETLSAGKFYLIGNPYPSALDANTFLNNNSFLDGTLYFWTHNTPVVLSGAYRYSATDYASYNMTGGVGGQPAISGNTGNNNSKPTGKIGAGQSFFASATTGGTVSFNNLMRLGGANNTQFYKSTTTSKEATIERNRVWLNMTNTEGAFKQMLVGYVEGASNEYEPRYDGVSFDANPYVDFFSVANGNNYVIQARALPFTDTDEVPLGYRTTIAGDFTISIDEVDGNLTNQTIYLEDKKTNVIHDLTASNYTFSTATGTFTDRLVLKYKNKTLGTGDFENIENGVLISVKNKTIQVTSSKEALSEVSVYDLTGKLLYNKKKVGTTELQISNLQLSSQVLFTKVTLENGYVISKKLIFN
ncbi:T9SS sorting signal type C domain-containing protein [Flavobacterium sp. ANB]|uniref:Ig-like domain-containing protein n=1 Tax=unclassified Flavobacterium TaxID=196869 RepID=UPI0012B9A05D|nr:MULTISPECIES: Ig-like domain-containing protein [unclassified Flavobacterium]MBF4517181.1 T9SS sorting signal type C domain-containing protein [Flavobacterium sp. ANB]MTD72526.1 T9SS sorting signal type C domain-containing protein [Flavobacterium sp. LC2016-13]